MTQLLLNWNYCLASMRMKLGHLKNYGNNKLKARNEEKKTFMVILCFMKRRVKSCCDVFVIFVFLTYVFLCKWIDNNCECNGTDVRVDLSTSNITNVFQKWSTYTVVGDGTKGERDVKYCGRRNTFHYSFRTNMISLKFSIVRRVLPLKK